MVNFFLSCCSYILTELLGALTVHMYMAPLCLVLPLSTNPHDCAEVLLMSAKPGDYVEVRGAKGITRRTLRRPTHELGGGESDRSIVPGRMHSGSSKNSAIENNKGELI